MAGNGSYDWADQWDYSDSKDVVTENTKKSGGGNTTTKYKQKVGEGLGKTKAVASNGVKKHTKMKGEGGDLALKN
ncbi:hypothetical protein SDJN02_14179, partial [Cucurbita argyrosperma subsp. argyrosperma]